jgi:hypothetical protein
MDDEQAEAERAPAHPVARALVRDDKVQRETPTDRDQWLCMDAMKKGAGLRQRLPEGSHYSWFRYILFTELKPFLLPRLAK